MKDEMFFDTNILFYAYDLNEPVKRNSCLSLVEDAFKGRINAVISNQILVELYNAFTRKLGVAPATASIIVRSLIVSNNWKKLNYDDETVNRALRGCDVYGVQFPDSLIAETMRENSVSEIITEDIRHFSRFDGIVVRYPFK